ncbi:hypothetical protein DXG03_000437 [Asterophora parasitica]|uniref:Alpha/beta-hydrolase n=1 Tax=Asterophora parasitica TaxID=117018 RepID=A0A9P7KFC9_9AGAR|nr:hypothetical protein DXG03_000437 [Asterophora parasitica]
MTELVKLPSGISLQVDLARPTSSTTEGEKLAICLHPWSWLGGQKDDPVLRSVEDELLESHFVLRYNSRGVGGSTGWSSFTGFSEAKDLEDLAEWAVQKISTVKALVLVLPFTFPFILIPSFKQMPLPDERPRQSVANLIGRFENQVRRQPSSSPGSARSSSVVSHTTGDSAKGELKEKREWPPKSAATDERPPPIVPSSSWSRSQAAAAQVSSPPKPRLVTATQADVEDSAPTPRTTSTTSMDDTRIASLPHNELTVAVTAPTPTSSNTLITAKPPSKTPLKAPISKPPLSSAPRTPAKATPRPSTGHPPTAQPLRPQHTGPASTSARKSLVPKSTPVTPARSKTPSRATPASTTPFRPKTPSSTRSKTPSTGLFAPTAASLAKSRNAPPLPPTPTKKVTLSSSAAERLSKPTAASLSKARTPTAVPARGGAKPPVRGGAAPQGTAKPRVSTASAATPRNAAAAATATVAVGAAIASVKVAHVADEAEEGSGHDPESIDASVVDGQAIHAESVTNDKTPTSDEVVVDDEASELAVHSDADAALEDDIAVAKSPEPVTEEVETLEVDEAPPAADERVDEVKSRSQVGDDIEDIVNLLETTSLSKVRPASIASIPDEVSEIPDEE